jgi:ribosomal protein L35
MSKFKTRKTLLKRIKITGSGKIMRKSVRMGHLKNKLDASTKSRKKGLSQVTNKRYIKNLKSLLGRLSKGL